MILSWNRFSGSIPSGIGNLKYLESLKLSSSNLTGPIATSLGGLVRIKDIDLSHHRLSGSIPVEICALFTLTSLDLSHNSLVGELPSSLGNLTKLTTLNLAYNNLGSSIISSFLLHFENNSLDLDGNEHLCAYEDLIRATEQFDIRYCTGTGGYGSVYKVQLPNGKVVALKKLHTSKSGQPALRKSFTNEVKTLTA
ncbi:receptor-like protein 33 [Ziziphus jujuba]|uniref:non-specific serine/threonine protein kinase n=1 Tax=Ziziphus jujuba TaxID=326968 RepID=A0ABM4AAR6_ZIZJJ|nr:receptor-like protein 33 [Ziziphus jujuba]